MRVFTTYQVASIVTKHGFRKIRSLRTQSGEHRYQIKDLTDQEWFIFENEDLTPAEVEELVEPGGWMILDAFTASAVKQVYEALSDLAKQSFDRVPMTKLASFAFAHSR